MSARERLLSRRVPPVVVTIRADFSPESDAAQAEVDAASRALHDAEARGADLTAARERLEAAQAAMAPYVEVLQAVPLPPHEYEALVSAHPAADSAWDPETFVPALMAACLLQDGEPVMSAEDWAEWARTPGAASSGELVTIFNLCAAINDRSQSVHVGKGSWGMPS